MSVRKVGVPVIVTDALSNVRPASASLTALEPSARSSRGALPTSTAAKTACRGSGTNARNGLRTTSWSSAGTINALSASMLNPVLSNSRNFTQSGLSSDCSPAAPSRMVVMPAST